jgi:hypothetical protein
MGRHECVRIFSDPSHSGGAEQGDYGQGLPLSDRPLLAQHSMVSNSPRVIEGPPQETLRVGSPPMAPYACYGEGLPQLPWFIEGSHLETIRCLL